MSCLDIDERLVTLADKIDMVYSPLVDNKEFPEMVDLTIVEGAVASNEDLEKIRKIRKHTKLLLSLGDCAVTGNVPSMRNSFDLKDVCDRAYVENATTQPGFPTAYLPVLEKRVRPVHEVVKVDVFVPGCPPPADAIFFAISELLAGRIPDPNGMTRFGK